MHKKNLLLCASLLTLPWTLFAQSGEDGISLDFHGAGWTEIGKIEQSYYNQVTNDLANNYNKNWLQDGGGQFNVNAKIDSNWSAGLGLGVLEMHLARGGEGQVSLWHPFWAPYVVQAQITYTHPAFTQDSKFQLTLGGFPYNYNPDAKNLGLYLMQGYVYPGALESGFGGLYGGADPSEFGGMVRYQNGSFHNDIIMKSEQERPVYDWSLIDVLSFQVAKGFELGAGINFYRLLANNSDLTSPGQTCGNPNYAGECYIVDSSVITPTHPNPDTITGSLAGTKAMARFHFDPKLLFGFSSLGSLALGEKDLVLYGEGAIIGFKNYPVYYDDVWKRMPVMLGFNFPVFNLLDYLSLEVEYYGSTNSSNNLIAEDGGGWVPDLQDQDNYKTRDHWKWSVNLAKMMFGHMQFSAQVAQDHVRLGGSHNTIEGGEALRTPEDWYWTCKLAYFF